MGFRIVGYVLIPQGGAVTYCSDPRRAANPTPPACSAGPAVRPLRCAQGRLCGSSSDAGSFCAAVALTSQSGVSRSGAREKRRPRRAGSALHWLGPAVKATARWKSRPSADGLESEPCATLLQPLFNDSMMQ
jgi:hypothetical protein